MSVTARNGDHSLRYGCWWAALILAALALWLVWHPVQSSLFQTGEDVLRLSGPLGILVLYLVRLRNVWAAGGSPWEQGSFRWVSLALCLGLLSFVTGGAIDACYALLNHPVPSPSAVDGAFLLSYPLLLASLLLWPSAALSLAVRVRALLDSLLAVSGVAAFSWYFLLGPTILREHASVLTKIVEGAYPLWDVVLVCCLLLIVALTHDHTFRRVALALGTGLALLVLADSIREYQILHSGLASGTALDLLRPLAFTLIGLAALTFPRRSAGVDTATSAPVSMQMPQGRALPRAWRYLLPYCSVPAVVALMIYAARSSGNADLAAGVYIAGALLIELVLLHQFLDYRELTSMASRSARLESLAAADPVTGLPNHREVVSALDRESTRARRYGHCLTVLFLDLDHFKALNDSYGHPAGDAALREFASVVRSALRGADILGRWGGEEFVAVLPETDGDAGLSVAERVRAAVAAHTFWAAGGAHLTCSIGMAAYPRDADTRDRLIERADGAMYVAKRLGRNQVCSTVDPAVALLGAETDKPGSREESAMSGTVEALSALLDARDHYIGQHAQDVSALAARLALEMGLDTSEAHAIGLAGRLHDIGKVAIPDSILGKRGALTVEEWTLMRTHPVVGAAAVSRVPKLGVLAPLIRGHHEHWNGTGYPDGLANTSIPMGARILAVADAYLAMTADRPYRRAIDNAAARHEIERCSGSQFDPAVVLALSRVLTVAACHDVA